MKIKEELVEKLAKLDTKEKIQAALDENKSEFMKAVKNKGFFDAVQERVVSRKLLVFGIASALFMWYGLDADTWGMIAMMYIGGQSAIDFAKIWKGQA